MYSRKIHSAYDMRTMNDHEFKTLPRPVFSSFQDNKQLTEHLEYSKYFNPISPASKLKFAADEALEYQEFLRDQHHATKPDKQSEERHWLNEQLRVEEKKVNCLEYELGMSQSRLGICEKSLQMFSKNYGNEARNSESHEKRYKLLEDKYNVSQKCNLSKDIQIMELGFSQAKKDAELQELRSKLAEKEKVNELSISIKFEKPEDSKERCLPFNHMNSTPIQRTTNDSIADKIGALFKSMQHKNKKKKAKKVIGKLDTLVESESKVIRKKKTKKCICLSNETA